MLDEYLWIVILGGTFAFAASMGIGANDAANAFATSVGAKTLKLWHALIICAIFEFSGAVFMGSHVGETVRKGITSEKYFEAEPETLMLGLFCVCLRVPFWRALATTLAMRGAEPK